MELDNQVLAVKVGGRSIADNLEQAVTAGEIRQRPDGVFEPISDGDQSLGRFIFTNGGQPLPCSFAMFMFHHAYARAAVPWVCRNCYKVVVASHSLRQLMAVKAVAEVMPVNSKSGLEVFNPRNSMRYATYVYADGLGQARSLYAHLRDRIDVGVEDGPAVTLFIKRACSPFERACGPSDRFSFDPVLERVENALQPCFISESTATAAPAKTVRAMKMMQMIKVAAQIGDETYRDFTAGRNLFPPLVTYSP